MEHIDPALKHCQAEVDAAANAGDIEKLKETSLAPMEERFSLSVNDSGDIKIYSFVTHTELLLPKKDGELLRDSLKQLDRLSATYEIICLDPSC